MISTYILPVRRCFYTDYNGLSVLRLGLVDVRQTSAVMISTDCLSIAASILMISTDCLSVEISLGSQLEPA